MAKSTFWLVGKQGSGKTTVAVALAAVYSRPGIVCALQAEMGMVCRYDAAVGDFVDDMHEPELLDSADFLFIEAGPDRFAPSMVRPGDLVVRLERVPVLQAAAEANTPAQGVAHG